MPLPLRGGGLSVMYRLTTAMFTYYIVTDSWGIYTGSHTTDRREALEALAAGDRVQPMIDRVYLPG